MVATIHAAPVIEKKETDDNGVMGINELDSLFA